MMMQSRIRSMSSSNPLELNLARARVSATDPVSKDAASGCGNLGTSQ